MEGSEQQELNRMIRRAALVAAMAAASLAAIPVHAQESIQRESGALRAPASNSPIDIRHPASAARPGEDIETGMVGPPDPRAADHAADTRHDPPAQHEPAVSESLPLGTDVGLLHRRPGNDSAAQPDSALGGFAEMGRVGGGAGRGDRHPAAPDDAGEATGAGATG